jgi:CRISPR-associated protein Csc1
MEVLEARIRTRGEITFTSREVGRLADTEPYVLNTALYYALGLAKGRYVDRSFEPTYVDDTEPVAEEVYVSPAAPVPGTTPQYVTTTYNTTRDEYAVVNYAAEDDPNESRNLPSYGRRRSLARGTDLRFFVVPRERDAGDVSADLPQYVRIGKKRGKARIDLATREATRHSGSFRLNHPIGAYDHDATPVGNVVSKSMQPTPMILQADYEGDFLRIDRSDADTDPEVVELPSGLTFLATKR